MWQIISISASHCVKSVRIRSFSGPYFLAFELNTVRYSVSLRIQSKCGKILTRKTPNTDTFHVVSIAQKIKFSIKHFFSKCDQIRRKLWIMRIWSHLLLADFVAFTEEILNGKIYLLCIDPTNIKKHIFRYTASFLKCTLFYKQSFYKPQILDSKNHKQIFVIQQCFLDFNQIHKIVFTKSSSFNVLYTSYVLTSYVIWWNIIYLPGHRT